MALEALASASPPPTPPPPHEYFAQLLDTTATSDISLPQIQQAHSLSIKHSLSGDSYVAGALVRAYSSPHLGCIHLALKVFDQVPSPHVFLYNSLARALLDNGRPGMAVSLYRRMVVGGSRPNKYTYPFLFKACAAMGAGEAEGRQIHAHAVKLGFGGHGHARSAGIQMYAVCGMLGDALKMFGGGGVEVDTVCWNAMIDGYIKCGEMGDARELFDRMPQRNVGSWNAVVSGYARHGEIELARELFEQMPERDEVSWSAMIDGYVQCGRSKDALAVFYRMQRERVAPKKYLMSSVLAACADVCALEQGRWVHAFIDKKSIPVDAVIGTALIDMYAKCGRLDLARDVFKSMSCKEIFTWNAMIGGFALHGHAEEAFETFSRMRSEGFLPNNITFVNMLNACAHSGMVEEGRKYFDSMQQDYGIDPQIEHYGCMIDLLGRAGHLGEAESMITLMPMKPNAAVWGALLGSCRIHGDAVLGERVGKILLELEPNNSGRYVLLSNIYAKDGKWDDASGIRKLMKERGVKTIPGISLIELKGMIHEFVTGDSSHPRIKEIHIALKEILGRLVLRGYVPNISQLHVDIDEEEKENALCYHSEKLAMAFGLLNTEAGATIRVVKNLRICEDCHTATKLISQVYKRDVIVRDRARFHYFKDGKCSCRDFW